MLCQPFLAIQVSQLTQLSLILPASPSLSDLSLVILAYRHRSINQKVEMTSRYGIELLGLHLRNPKVDGQLTEKETSTYLIKWRCELHILWEVRIGCQIELNK